MERVCLAYLLATLSLKWYSTLCWIENRVTESDYPEVEEIIQRSKYKEVKKKINGGHFLGSISQNISMILPPRNSKSNPGAYISSLWYLYMWEWKIFMSWPPLIFIYILLYIYSFKDKTTQIWLNRNSFLYTKQKHTSFRKVTVEFKMRCLWTHK